MRTVALHKQKGSTHSQKMRPSHWFRQRKGFIFKFLDENMSWSAIINRWKQFSNQKRSNVQELCKVVFKPGKSNIADPLSRLVQVTIDQTTETDDDVYINWMWCY